MIPSGGYARAMVKMVGSGPLGPCFFRNFQGAAIRAVVQAKKRILSDFF
jgi:hypothetical protein